ncbi:MAG: hypothetical protein HQK99_12145 [Nitrospirae bacterium]|nr:hypothetical protein [Nitrospirota bacterium]
MDIPGYDLKNRDGSHTGIRGVFPVTDDDVKRIQHRDYTPSTAPILKKGDSEGEIVLSLKLF